MKRCPECKFLYENAQERCDMDGTVLRFTSFLPPLEPSQPIAKDGPKSIWTGLTISLLTLVVIGSVLVTLYRAAPPKLSSSSAKDQPASTNEDRKLPVSDSPQAVPAVPAKPAQPSPSRPVQSSNQSRLTIEPARDPFEPPFPVVNAPKAAPSQTSPPPSRQKAVAASNPIAVHPEPPPVKPTLQSKTQNQDKDSKVNSLFKKAGRVLKRPF